MATPHGLRTKTGRLPDSRFHLGEKGLISRPRQAILTSNVRPLGECRLIFLQEPAVVFLKPRKVAGTSFEIALSKFAAEDSVITPISREDEITRRNLGCRGAQNYAFAYSELESDSKRFRNALYDGKMPSKFYNHIPAKLAKERLGGWAWHKSLKISIIRNPFDQLVSLYFWQNKNAAEKPHFQNWIAQNPSFLRMNYEQTHIDGECIVDFFIRYEAFEADIRALEHQLPRLSGLWDIFSNLSAKGGIRPKESAPASFFAGAPELVGSVKFFNSDIIERFGYELN